MLYVRKQFFNFLQTLVWEQLSTFLDVKRTTCNKVVFKKVSFIKQFFPGYGNAPKSITRQVKHTKRWMRGSR